MPEGPSLLPQIPPHSFAEVTSSYQLTNQARITTVLHEGSKLVSDPEFTKSRLSTEHFESKPPSRVQVNHHLILQFLLTPFRLNESSIVFAQSLKLERATAIYELQEHSTHNHESQNKYQDEITAIREKI